jgi:hypothetical protein
MVGPVSGSAPSINLPRSFASFNGQSVFKEMGMNTRFGRTLLALGLGLVVGCGSDNNNGGGSEGATGTLRVPLAATSYSAKSYVLCQGIFSIYGYNSGQTWTIDASEHQTEAFVTQALPSGGYEVMLSGWQLCQATAEGLVPVDAQLWSSDYQYVNISPLQASYVYFSFMVQGEQLAFDGQLVIQIDVWEGNYGYGGYPGADGGYGAAGGTIPFPTTGGSYSAGGVAGF